MSAMSTQFAELSEIKELSETIDKLTDYLMGDGVMSSVSLVLIAQTLACCLKSSSVKYAP